MSKKLLVILTSMAILVHIGWALLPQVEWRWQSEEELVILSYGAYGANLHFQPWVSWVYVVVSTIILGVFLIGGARMRHRLLAFWLASLVVFVSFGGIVSESGLSMTFRDFQNLLIGAMLAIAYTSRPPKAVSGTR